MSVFEGKRELLDAFRAGTRPALEVVYAQYVDDVFDLVRFGFMLRDGKRVPGTLLPDAQHDLLHDVFVKAFSSTGRQAYDGLRPYRPFLMRLAKNVIIDGFRARDVSVSVDDIDDDLPAPASPPEDDLFWRKLANATRDWRQGLGPEEQRFVALRFGEDLAQRDVAARMGATRRRVRTLENAVRGGLLAYLKRLGLAE